MAKTGRAILTVLLIVLLAAAVIGGIFYYTYVTTDETVVPTVEVTLNDAPLSYHALEWYTPVFDGLVYKHYAEAVDRSAEPLLLNSASFVIKTPAGFSAECTVRDSAGNVLENIGTDTFKYSATANGDYTYDLTLSVPQTRGEAYGSWHYTGHFTVRVEPQITLSSTHVVQGDVLTVLVTGVSDTPEPTMAQNISYAHFAKRGSNYSAEIGVGYNVSPGTYVVAVACGDKQVTETVTVAAATFSRQDMTIDEDTIAETNTAEASAQWREAIWTLYETADDTVYWEGQFQSPVTNTEINTEYGLYRYTNGSANADRHGGVDFDSDEGDPVYAPNNGRVVYAGFLTLTGNTIVIEHGAGLKSYIFHMSELNCSTGDMVQTGDLIGAVGSTGYSTGPHMHYEVKIGRQSVDPLRLLDGTSGLYLAS